ncbi:unnamed protein product, partial [Prorocentrum cordatum]
MVCIRRQHRATALHSLFFFGLPLSNLRKDWNSAVPGPEFTESSKFLMDWIFTAYNDMLMAENKMSSKKGLVITFDANNLQNSDPLLMR